MRRHDLRVPLYATFALLLCWVALMILAATGR